MQSTGSQAPRRFQLSCSTAAIKDPPFWRQKATPSHLLCAPLLPHRLGFVGFPSGGLSSPSLLQQAPGPGSTGDADSPIPPAGGLSRQIWGWEQHKTAPKWKETSAVVPRCAPGKGWLDFCPSRAAVMCPSKPCPAHPAALLLGRTWAGELKEPAKPVMALR